MIKAVFKTMLGLALVVGVLGVTRAEDKKVGKKPAAKAVTLKGEIGCPKCVFGIAKACANAIKVKEGGKEVIYTFIDKGRKEPYHKAICTSGKAGSVKGVVSKKGDKHFITPAKGSVKFD